MVTVTRAESASAKCRSYSVIPGLPAGIHSMDYIHCDGTQLKLADTNLGSQRPFHSSNHYQWTEVDLFSQRVKVNHSDYINYMHINYESCDFIKVQSLKMSVLSFAHVLRSYFLFSLIVGFIFICDKGEWAWGNKLLST